MNKRGFLLAEETLKIVIAVIAIGFLIYFLTSIYLRSQESKDLELAKSSLEHLISEINLESSEVEIYNPKGWVVVSWPSDIISRTLLHPLSGEVEKDMPNFCENLNWETCLCICKNRKAEDCDEKGVCENNENKLVVKGEWDSVILYREQVLEGDKNYIEIENPPLKLKINYQEDRILITK